MRFFIFLNIIFLFSTKTISQANHFEARNTISVSKWLFQKGVHYKAYSENYDETNLEKVTIPHTFSMDAINDVGYYRGETWYRTKIELPTSMKGKRIFIRFEGVGHDATVYVNEKKAGKHVGGYSAFIFEITDKIDFNKENLIAVKVTNEPNFKRIPVTDKLFNIYGGIYRPVQLFSTPKTAISPLYFASSGVFIEQKELTKEKAIIEVRTHVSNLSENNTASIIYKILDVDKNIVFETEKPLKNLKENSIITEEITLSNPILWNGKINPHLYSIQVSLESKNTSDSVTEKFGLRTYAIDAKNGFTLNNKPYRVYGVAMHQEWKQFGPALLKKHHQKDLDLIDEIGATGLRLSHYQHSKTTYDLADKKGLLVWTEIPFVHDYSGREGRNAQQQLKELILQNYNHPSIFVWGLWNEVRAWESPEEPPVKLTKELKQTANNLDPNRLTASASDRGIVSNMGNITDLQAWNKYYGWYYGEYNDMAKWLDNARSEYPSIALGISEYGIGGNITQQDKTKLEKPNGNYFPEIEQTNYHEITWKIIKDRPFVWGSFIWNMFDFSVAGWNRGGIPNLNHKGIISFDRKTKKDAFYFYKANWSNEPVLHIAETRNTERKEAITNVKVFTNLTKVTLFINGKKIGVQKQINDMNTITFKNIQLLPGENIIKVFSKKGKEQFSHKAIWNLK